MLKNASGRYCYRDKDDWNLGSKSSGSNCAAHIDAKEGPLPVGAHTWRVHDGTDEWVYRTLTVTLLTTQAEVAAAEQRHKEAFAADSAARAAVAPGLPKTQSSLVDGLDKNVRSMLHSTMYNFVVFAVCCVLWGSLCSLNAGGWYDTSRVDICWICFALLHLDLQLRCKLWRGRYGWSTFWHFPEDFYRQ